MINDRPRIIVSKPAPDLPPSNLPNLRGPLFKYLKREHADGMMLNGIVRVGTMVEYQDEGRFGTAIGDWGEGQKVRYDDTPFIYGKDPGTHSDVFRECVTGAEGKEITIRGIGFAVEEESADVLVYSLSREFRSEAYDWFADRGYNACIRIDDPHGFFEVLTAQLAQHWEILTWAVDSCTYEARVRHHTIGPGVHPALLKKPGDAKYAEIRGLWCVRETPIRGGIYTCGEALARYCSLHDAV